MIEVEMQTAALLPRKGRPYDQLGDMDLGSAEHEDGYWRARGSH